jgi:hypothetical protein
LLVTQQPGDTPGVVTATGVPVNSVLDGIVIMIDGVIGIVIDVAIVGSVVGTVVGVVIIVVVPQGEGEGTSMSGLSPVLPASVIAKGTVESP